MCSLKQWDQENAQKISSIITCFKCFHAANFTPSDDFSIWRFNEFSFFIKERKTFVFFVLQNWIHRTLFYQTWIGFAATHSAVEPSPPSTSPCRQTVPLASLLPPPSNPLIPSTRVRSNTKRRYSIALALPLTSSTVSATIAPSRTARSSTTSSSNTPPEGPSPTRSRNTAEASQSL